MYSGKTCCLLKARRAPIDRERVEPLLTGSCLRLWPEDIHLKVLKGFQASVTLMLTPKVVEVDERLRHKLGVWDVTLYIGPRARKAASVARRLTTFVPPRVQAAVLRTWWNGWVTVRRVGQHHGLKSRCFWGCRCDDGD